MSSITSHQAKYIAHALTRKAASNDREKLMGTILDAQVEPKPHQIEAALFAFQSPFSKGAILADEVGLGKTIEAGIVLSQYWSEHKRKLFIVCPANLRQQWSQELRDKFFLQSEILDSKKIQSLIPNNLENSENNKSQPSVESISTYFSTDKIYIASYHFASRYSSLLALHNWNLLVFDEAHKLRNVYKSDSSIANAIKIAFQNTPKILLTATPLQNSLLELYGLVSIIDPDFFGSFESFKEEYITTASGRGGHKKLSSLRKRLGLISNRTLRQQVQEYINYTSRRSITQRFNPTIQEIQLYEKVTEYLAREQLYAFTSSQRTLTTLLMLKLLGSSAFAIAGTLDKLANRLESEAQEGVRRDAKGQKYIFQNIDEDLENSLSEDMEDSTQQNQDNSSEQEDIFERPLTPEEIAAMLKEAEELRDMAYLAKNITQESKGSALLQALELGFNELPKLNAQQKAIIFTESTRTQEYLYNLLSENGYQDDIVLFNGSGGGSQGSEIYKNWLEKNKDTDAVSGVLSADKRAAITQHFKQQAKIMIATEAAGEGINLQFCSMVINYDLPWNPQRVEQRIGRCHRYGQKSDVIVVNFLNEHNKAEQRILELLQEKFQLFDGVFGASDQVLGAIESGFDFERRIADIVRTCRTQSEIERSFDQLQTELSTKIDKKMRDTKKVLLDNFDSEVAEKLKISRDESVQYLTKYEEWLWKLAQHQLTEHAQFFSTDLHSFKLLTTPQSDIPTGTYYLGQHDHAGYKLRLAHPLTQHILLQAKNHRASPASIVFNYSGATSKSRGLEKWLNQSGSLTVALHTRSSKAQTEEHLLVTARTDNDEQLPTELAQKILDLPAQVEHELPVLNPDKKQVQQEIQLLTKKLRKRDTTYFREQADKFDAWAADMRRSARMKISKLDKAIRSIRQEIRHETDIEQELKHRQKLRKLEKSRDMHELDYRKKVREIDTQTDELLDTIEQSLEAIETTEYLFTIQWRLN